MTHSRLDEFISFGDWVRRRRKTLDLTQADLARRIGCAAVTIKKIEREERRPSPEMAQLLADHLAIPQARRADFMRLARGQFAVASPEALPPPRFLLSGLPPTQAAPSRFVARAAELAWLEAHLKLALAGQGRVVFISGEAGEGKTGLMAEFARRAQAAQPDLVVAGGNCNAQTGPGDPYLPFRDGLSMLTGDLETRWLAGDISSEQVLQLWALLPHTIEIILEHGPDLIDRLIPGAALIQRLAVYAPGRADWLDRLQSLARQPQARPEALAQPQLLEQVTQVFRLLAGRRPLLLLLDDLQWIDDASNNLLFHLGRRLAGSRILLVGAYRPSEVIAARPAGHPEQNGPHPLKQTINEFIRQYGDIQLNLSCLDPVAGRAFIEALLDSEPNRLGYEFRARLFRHTQGQPLFSVELLRHMQDSGYLIRDEMGRWVEKAGSTLPELPLRVEAVIARRIDRLDDRLQEMLTVAGVEGELFTGQVIARILGLDERLVLRHLRDLVQRHHLVREHREITAGSQHLSRYQFGQRLFQHYLYERLSQAERRLYHREVAEALEALLEDPAAETPGSGQPGYLEEFDPSLAHHFWQGEVWPKAAAYALRLATRARQAYAWREAIEHYERALEALEKAPNAPEELVHETILNWAEAAFKFRPYAEQLRRLAQAEAIARRLEDKSRLIEALHWTANVHLARGLWGRAEPALRECFVLAEALGQERLAIRPTYFRAVMTAFWDPRGALALFERTLDLARRYGDPHMEAFALATKGQVQAQLGDFTPAQESMQRAAQVVSRLESPLTESDVDLFAGWAYLAMGDTRRGLEYGRRSLAKAIAADNMDCICYGFDCVGYGYLQEQKIPEATLAFEEAIKRSDLTGATVPKLLGQAGLAAAQFYSGRVEAIQDLEAALADMKAHDNQVGAADTAHLLGICLTGIGAWDRAENYLSMALDFYRNAGMRPYLARALASLAQLFEKQGRPTEAQTARAEAETLLAALAVTPEALEPGDNTA